MPRVYTLIKLGWIDSLHLLGTLDFIQMSFEPNARVYFGWLTAGRELLIKLISSIKPYHETAAHL
jgi:hypothetical protein